MGEIVDRAESENPTIRQAGTRAFLALTELTGEAPLALSLAEDLLDEGGSGLEDQIFVRGWRVAWRHEPTADQAKTSLTAWLDTPSVPDDHAVEIAVAVQTGNLMDPRTADLLVGQSATTQEGRARRVEVFNRLLPTVPEQASSSQKSEDPGAQVAAEGVLAEPAA
ncbi:hypothetical protein [Streptomyces mayteni]